MCAGGEVVVVKRATQDVVAAEALRRVQHEHDMLQLLRGPGIVEVRELVRDGTDVALVMECFGESLGAVLESRRFALAEALEVGLGLARVLARVHAAGVIHKDVNPSNVLYDARTHELRLIDFDIATRYRHAHREVIPASRLEGTLRYMAPEQTGRLNRAVDCRSDLYSLGVTLHHVLVGSRPFEGDDALGLVHAHLATTPPRVDAIDPTIPVVVADIVARLLAKSAEARYQTATGLVKDLAQALAELRATGGIEPFAIGVGDVSTGFEFPDRLYGRGPEVRALLDAFARTARGNTETVHIAGYSGIGKSSVVREIIAPVTAARGYVAAGKFEQLRSDTPYSAVAAALGELVAQVLADGDAAHARWRSDLAKAVDADGALVVAIVPALAQVLPAVQPCELDADTERRRLSAALARVVSVFAQPHHPLVLFLDDMQWADAASLQLLTAIATDEREQALLLIEAYRDNELDASHACAAALRDQEKCGAKITRIALAALDLADTTELIADALRCSAADVRDVASIIWRKTEGNPFFLRQFLQTLHDEDHLTFEVASGTFVIDPGHLESAGVTDNVAVLLAHSLAKLPAAAREVLPSAAAIGNRFELRTLARVTERAEIEVHAAIVPALDAGLIVPLGASSCIDVAPDGTAVLGFTRFAFQHDRVQRAAYDLVALEQRASMHARIGRCLLASSSNDDDALFEIVHHMNRGLSEVVDPDERSSLVRLELTAARRARRAGACDVASQILRCARELVHWRDDYPTCLAIHLELAQVLAIAGTPDEARATVRATIQHASARDRATLEALETILCIQLGRLAESLVCGRRAAALLGLALPDDPAELATLSGAEIGRIMGEQAVSPVETWLDRPAMTDPDKLAAMELLVNLIPAAYQAEPALLVLVVAKLITLSLDHGQCPLTARGYLGFAIILWAKGDYALGYRFGRAGVTLNRRVRDDSQETAVDFTFAIFASPWQRPIDESVALLRNATARGVAAGQPAYAAYATVFELAYRSIKGDRLQDVIDDGDRHRKLALRLGMPDIDQWIRRVQWHARSFTGGHGEDLDPVEVEREIAARGGGRSIIVQWWVQLLEQAFWRGDHADVVVRARAIAAELPSLFANLYNAELRFYACLAAVAATDAPLDPMFEKFRADLARYADTCPQNFGHMSHLVEAEFAAARGDVTEALRRYDAAVESAAEHGFLKVEILAHELAGRFWAGRDKAAFAAIHYGKARDLCEHWGAVVKANELERKRRSLGGAAIESVDTLRSTVTASNTLDFATIVKASQAIASDIVLDSLLGKIVAMIVENAGAQTASIVLESNGELFVHATKHVDGTVTLAKVPLADAVGVSAGIVKYVARTVESIAVSDATRHPTFRTDPHVRDRRPRSVLCMPIVHKDRLVGAVYLENNLVAGAFTVERLDALGILLSQLAISIENATVFARLEELVAERTRELTEANRELRVQSAARERMESELRLAQKLQSVGQLAAGVAHEINTPIQFVGNSLEFMRSAFDDVLRLVDECGEGAEAASEIGIDVDFLRAEIPTAIDRASSGVQRVAKIVSAMKAFSHPDQRGQTPTNLQYAIETTLAVAVSEYRDIANVVLDLAPIPAVVCHPGEINQVLLNLVVNAAHAIEDVVGRTPVRGTITIATRHDGADVEIAITDTGCGIPEEIRERVFDPFFTTKAVGRGTGQGLALARTTIVDRHGGTLDFESRVGSGTTFRIRLPIGGAMSSRAA
jgi:predicted ATPase/signal transduction histidine kinase